MSLGKRERPEARDELREAATWYDDAQPGIGDDFYDAIDDAIRQIRDWPLSAPVFPGWEEQPTVRSKAVRVFPYRIMYYVTDTNVVIVAYARHRRTPGYWQHRLDR